MELISVELVLPVIQGIWYSNFVWFGNARFYPSNHGLYVNRRKIARSGNNEYSSESSITITRYGRATHLSKSSVLSYKPIRIEIYGRRTRNACECPSAVGIQRRYIRSIVHTIDTSDHSCSTSDTGYIVI